MKLSTRLTRAGASFLIFGMVAAAIPNSGIVGAGACGGGGSNDDSVRNEQIVTAAVLGFATGYLIDKRWSTHHGTDTDTGSANVNQTAPTTASDNQWQDLHNFTAPASIN
jgi:hypothetical protein